MTDRTPADAIEQALLIASDDVQHLGGVVLEALAAAGFRVVPIPDDNTRAEVEALVERAKDRKTAYEVCKRYGITNSFDHIDLSRLERMVDLLAAAYLDGQPQDRPATCPTCGSRSPQYAVTGSDCDPLAGGVPDAWHVGGSGDTR